MRELTGKQSRYCEEYIIDLNATQAALRAGYSKNTSRIIGCQNLTKLNIQEEIQRLKSERSDRVQIEADSVVQELSKIAFSNIKNYLSLADDEVYFKNLNEVPDEITAAVESIKIYTTKNKDGSREYTTTQFKLHSKLNALEQLGKHLGVYEADNTQKGDLIVNIVNFSQIDDTK